MLNTIDIMERFGVLCAESRVSGSAFNEQVRDIIVEELKSMGFKIDIQTVPFTGWCLVEEPRVKFTHPEERDAQIVIPVVWSGSTLRGGGQGRLIPQPMIRTFERYHWERYAIIGSGGTCVAYLITREDFVWTQCLNEPEEIPYIIIGPEDCKQIWQWMEEGKQIHAYAFVSTEFITNQHLNNIIASYNKPDKSQIVVSTHYDSFFNTVGAHDNASGVVTWLELARKISVYDSEKLRFIAFDAEEWNKSGSYAYVNTLEENNNLNQVELVINIDSVGAGDSLYILTSPGVEEKVREILSGGSGEIRVDITSEEAFQQFDTWPFMQKGIPVMQIGSRSQPPFRYFHHPKDNLDNINSALINATVRVVDRLIQGFIS